MGGNYGRLVGVVVRRYMDFLILLISTVSALFCSSIPTFFQKMFFIYRN